MSGARLARSTLISRVAVQVLTLSFNILSARLLGPQGKGVVSLAMLWSLALSSVATAGMEVGLTFFTSRTPASARSYFRVALRHAFIVGGLVSLAFVSAATKWHFMAEAPRTVVWITALMIPVQAAMLLGTGVFAGAGLLTVANWALLAGWTINVAATALMMMYGSRGESLLLSIITGSTLLQVVVMHLAISRRRRTDQPIAPLRELAAYSGKAYLGTLAGLLHMSAAGIILGMVSGAAATGVYSVAYAVAAALYLPPVVIGTILLPQVSSSQQNVAEQVAVSSVRASLVITVLLSIGAIATSIVAVPLLFGRAFASAVPLVALLIPAAIGFSVAKPLTAYFQGRNRPDVGSTAALLGLTVVVAAGWPLASEYGAPGAAAAMSLSTLAVAALQLTLFIRDASSVRASNFVPRGVDLSRLLELATALLPGDRRARHPHVVR